MLRGGARHHDKFKHQLIRKDVAEPMPTCWCSRFEVLQASMRNLGEGKSLLWALRFEFIPSIPIETRLFYAHHSECSIFLFHPSFGHVRFWSLHYAIKLESLKKSNWLLFSFYVPKIKYNTNTFNNDHLLNRCLFLCSETPSIDKKFTCLPYPIYLS